MLFVSVHEPVPLARRYRHLGWFLWGGVLGAAVYAFLASITTGAALS